MRYRQVPGPLIALVTIERAGDDASAQTASGSAVGKFGRRTLPETRANSRMTVASLQSRANALMAE